MKAAQAVRILALAAEDDFEAAKKKYRKLMGQFHPDSAGAGEPEYVRQEYVRRSQEINEAYRVTGESGERRMGAGAEPVSGNDRRAGIRAKRIEHFWNVEQWEKTQQTCNREHILAPI